MIELPHVERNLSNIYSIHCHFRELAKSLFEGTVTFKVRYLTDMMMAVPEYACSILNINNTDINKIHSAFRIPDMFARYATIIQWNNDDGPSGNTKYDHAILCINNDLLKLHYIFNKESIDELYTNLTLHEYGHYAAANHGIDPSTMSADEWEDTADKYGNADSERLDEICIVTFDRMSKYPAFVELCGIHDEEMRYIRGKDVVDNILVPACHYDIDAITKREIDNHIYRTNNVLYMVGNTPVINIEKVLTNIASERNDLIKYPKYILQEYNKMKNDLIERGGY